uniref:Tetraspanin n=1 Tax=Enterobius vermicularis TaxID=51028 RepID=A0A0N4VMG4_ENTVE
LKFFSTFRLLFRFLGVLLLINYSLWRVKRRQREVSKENDFYGKLLAEALPFVYEGSKIYPCANGLLADQEAAAGNVDVRDLYIFALFFVETGVFLTGAAVCCVAEFSFSTVIVFPDYTTELQLPNLAICAPNALSAVAPMRKSLRNVGSWKQQNGWRANGMSNPKKLSQGDSNIISSRRDRLSIHTAHDEDDSASNSSIPQTSRLTRWRFVWDFLSGIYLFFVKGNSGESSSQLDDRLSLSSNEVESEEEMGDQDDNSQIDDGFNRFTSNRANTSKRTKANGVRSKGGRSRGGKSQNHTDLCLPAGGSNITSPSCNVNNVLTPNCNSQERHICPVSTSTNALYSSTSNGVCTTGSTATLNDSALYTELESLREEIKTVRSEESGLRLSNSIKAREQDKASVQLMEKRLIEAQTKARDLEKDLSNERKLKEQHARASLHNAKLVPSFIFLY